MDMFGIKVNEEYTRAISQPMHTAMNRLVLIVTLTICANIQHVLSVEYSPIVQLTNGKVRGLLKDVKPFGEKVYFYEGIRYGHAERFSASKPVGPWTDVYDAIKPRDACPQRGTHANSEDCLFLSVWRPIKESSKSRAVMVFIHGGGYNSGSIFTIDCSNIVSQGDVIVVTINYRLGAFGFLFGDTKDAPGNLGLRDQILALHWVKENIGHFGGDPNMVTVLGQSAGSFAVGSLIQSPLAKGLFIRAIMQSGGPISAIAKKNQSTALQMTQQLAHSAGCPSETIQTSISCLRHNKTISQIVSQPINQIVVPIYGDEVLPISPDEALTTGKFNHDIDLMFGITSKEGSYFVIEEILMVTQGQKMTTELAQLAIKNLFNYTNYSSEVAAFYTAKLTNNSTQDQLNAIAEAWGDGHLSCPTILFGEEFARNKPTQHAAYSYRFTMASPTGSCNGWMSACHGDDMFYLFYVPLIASNPKLLQLSQEMIRAWTEFAKTGKPTKMGNVEWSPAYDQNMGHNQHMNIDPDDYKMVNDFYKDTCDAFWKLKIDALPSSEYEQNVFSVYFMVLFSVIITYF